MSTTSDDDDLLRAMNDEDAAAGLTGWDCSAILDVAAAEEASFSMQYPTEAVDFGHPDPPRVQVFPVFGRSPIHAARNSNRQVQEDVVLVVSYTEHCVVTQALQNGSRGRSSEVLVIGSLPVIEDKGVSETIQCLTIVARESLDFLNENDENAGGMMDIEEPTQSNSNNDNAVQMDTSPDDMDDPRLQNPSAAPLPQEFQIAILIGTSCTRVYSVEVLVTVSTASDNQLETTLSFSPTMVARNAKFVEVLPPDDDETIDMLERYGRKHRGAATVQPFVPWGRVLSIVPFRLKNSSGPVVRSAYGTYIWISYQDGSLVRLHHAAVFPSVWEIGAARGISLEELLQPVAGFDSAAGGVPVVRCQLMLSPNKHSEFNVIPLPCYHPSPLAPLPSTDGGLDTEESSAMDSFDDTLDETKVEPGSNETFEALVFGDKDDPLTPTLVFYSSEDQFVGRIKGDVDVRTFQSGVSDGLLSSVVGSTKAVVDGVAGVFRWGLGRRDSAASVGGVSRRSSLASIPDGNMTTIEVDYNQEELPISPFPTLWRPPQPLYAGHEFHDAPREIESCVVDPNGRLAALTDSLGRVLLLDLSTKQIIRMWKGFRETSCHWLQSKGKKGNTAAAAGMFPTTHLAIHSRHRRILEIWKIRQGPRVQLTKVDRDAIVVSSPMIGRSDMPSNMVESFILHSNVPDSTNQMERVQLLQASTKRLRVSTKEASASVSSSTALASSRGAALRLQHLRQLLSATDLQYTKNDILEAVRKIKSLGDLTTALDLIGTAPVLEERFGVEGSSFQKSIIEYCNETLSDSTSDGNTDILHSPSAKDLSRKLEFYSRLTKAYDIIDSFKSSVKEQPAVAKDGEPFVKEAKGWVTTYEKVTGSSILDTGSDRKKQRLRFSSFAASVVFPSNEEISRKMQIYFSDSTRTRGDVLVHVFKPLLGWFSSGIVGSFFDVLSIKDDDSYIQKCFGEWFMTLSKDQMVQHGLSLPDSPINRFLEDIAEKHVMNESGNTLDALFQFCCESMDIIRGFLLTTLCLRAVTKAANRIENVSKGKISLGRLTFEWEVLLRKYRVCLLARLRLDGQRLGGLPLSVYNLEVENEFSVYEWLAHDELAISHRHEEIVILEEVCRMSTHSFDPSTELADDSSRVSILQNACLAKGQSVIGGEDIGSSSLLLYFVHHNNAPVIAAHRSLLLASSWLKTPERLDLLADSLEAANALTSQPGLALAVRLELWTRVVCPLYRARLFGFVDVPELVEEDFATVLQQRQWLYDFGRLSLRILDLVAEIQWSDNLNKYEWPESDENDEWWPPLRPDFILERALRKVRPLDDSARDAHYVVICGLLVSDDMNALAPCIPAIYDCFLSLSIFNPVTVLPSTSPEQDTFLASAILLQARNYSGPPLDQFRLGELAVLGEKWGFSLATLRTLYLLAMYEFGKDLMVDDLLTRAFTQVDAIRFLDGGLDIVCRRLDTFFQSSFMKTRHMREVMGVLDADLCDWIQQQAAMADESPVWEFPEPVVGLNMTHVLALRLLSLSKTANVDTTLRVKIHSLAVLSGTLLKEVEESRRQQEKSKK